MENLETGTNMIKKSPHKIADNYGREVQVAVTNPTMATALELQQDTQEAKDLANGGLAVDAKTVIYDHAKKAMKTMAPKQDPGKPTDGNAEENPILKEAFEAGAAQALSEARAEKKLKESMAMDPNNKWDDNLQGAMAGEGCVICGHSPASHPGEPLVEGDVCDECNVDFVVPFRFAQLKRDKQTMEEIQAKVAELQSGEDDEAMFEAYNAGYRAMKESLKESTKCEHCGK
jgi:CRISPR/Cas system-associated protein Cas10 (large subunit of type III CRISPR-Cas system)